MLRHLGLSCFDGRILVGRPSIMGLRSIHRGRRRESPVHDSPAAAAEDPGWVMLNRYGIRTDDSFVADAKTVAHCRTYTGQHLRVSFGRAPPPASSFLYYDFLDSAPGEEKDDDVDECEEEDDVDELHISVVAAHGDSVLLKMSHRRLCNFEEDHFLYRAGAVSPPVMSLLPDRDFLTKSEQVYADCVSPPIRPIVHRGTTGLLRRGDGDVLLVDFDLLYDRSLRREMAEFCLLHHGSSQWELKDPVPIIQDEGGKGVEQLEKRCGIDTIIPLGDRFLCWVTYQSGFLLCDMADEASPKVRYVPLPSGLCWDPKEYERDMSIKHSMNMGAAGPNASAVRFVSIDPHCCCGGPGRSTCAHSRYAFTINTWTMNLSMDEPLTWVKDGEIDCEELWGLPGYEGLPRTNFMCPVVCLDNPNVICFLVSNYHLASSYEDWKLWMIQLNMKSKTLLSVVQYNNDSYGAYDHLPARLHCSQGNTW